MAIHVRGLSPLLQVYDMPVSVRFYRDVLGFELVTTSPNLGGDDKFHWCLLRLGECELMLNTAYEFDAERPVPPDAVRVAAHDDTCIYFGAPDVDAVYDELRKKGLDLKPPKVAPYGMKQLYFHDPDGYNLCFQWAANQ
ncbi:MAG: VOC family protein [Acidobacteriia bacterium]|nr:VOC family protein [Terriglobia bacterium]